MKIIDKTGDTPRVIDLEDLATGRETLAARKAPVPKPTVVPNPPPAAPGGGKTSLAARLAARRAEATGNANPVSANSPVNKNDAAPPVTMQTKTRPPTASTSPDAVALSRKLMATVHATSDPGDQIAALALTTGRLAGLRGASLDALHKLIDHVYHETRRETEAKGK